MPAKAKSHGKTAPQASHTRFRKSNSCTDTAAECALPDRRIPDGSRDRPAHGSSEGESIRPSRLHYDPGRIPPRGGRQVRRPYPYNGGCNPGEVSHLLTSTAAS